MPLFCLLFVALFASSTFAQSQNLPPLPWHISKIQADRVWNEGITGSKNVNVAVVDSGVKVDHEAIKDNILPGWNFFDNNQDLTDFFDHGTAMAAIIGATGKNDEGVIGVSPVVSLLPLKVMDRNGGITVENLATAVVYACKMGAKIVNGSWVSPDAEVLQKAVKYCSDQGALVVLAAGNDQLNMESDQAYFTHAPLANIIRVGGSAQDDTLWKYSNHGRYFVDVIAPGEEIMSASSKRGYEAHTGTSQATAVVSGLAALLWAAHPEWSASEIKKRIISGCDPIPALRHMSLCRGRVNAYNALHGIVPPDPNPDDKDFKTAAFTAESTHPYTERENDYWTAHVEGAKYIRVHFSKIETESLYDHIYIENPAGEVFEWLDGDFVDYTTNYVEGDTVKIHMKTDGSNNFWGFAVDRVEVIR